MAKIDLLRREARRLFTAAVAAADPAPALATQLTARPLVPLRDGRYILIAVGKAACTMMAEALHHLPDGAAHDALAVTNYENARDIPGARVIAAGHPVPDANGARAAEAVIALLEGATAGDRVIALISGGGSALLPAPIPGVSLTDKAEVSRILLAEGFDITEMNLVRQHLSRLKGGGFVRLAAPAPVRAFILSDVIGDDLRVIASGPTASPVGTLAEARKLLVSRKVFDRLPLSVQGHLQKRNAAEPEPVGAENVLICSNRQSLDAAAAASSVPATVIDPPLTGDVADATARLLQKARSAAPGTALILGGETTVTLRGTGLGGRNQELALRFALGAGDLTGDWVFLSGGTDGRDGPTEAAGGLVDPGSLSRMRAAGADPQALLADNDSHAALEASGDLLITGGTGTNVADVQIFLRG